MGCEFCQDQSMLDDTNNNAALNRDSLIESLSVEWVVNRIFNRMLINPIADSTCTYTIAD